MVHYAISSSYVWIWELDDKEVLAPKNWCFWTMEKFELLEKILESPLDCKEIKQVNPKGNQPWIFIGRADAEALIPWLPDVKSWLIGKDPDAGRLNSSATLMVQCPAGCRWVEIQQCTSASRPIWIDYWYNKGLLYPYWHCWQFYLQEQFAYIKKSTVFWK